MTKTLTIALVLAIGLSGLSAWAQIPPAGNQPKPLMPQVQGPACPASAMMIPSLPFADRPPAMLNLTETQRTQIKDILVKAHSSLKSLREAGSKASADLFTEVVSANADPAKVQTLKDAAVKCESDQLKLEMDTWTQIKGVLNAEQLARVSTMIGPHRGIPGKFPPGAPGVPGTPVQSPDSIRGKTDPNAPPVPIEAPPPAPAQ